jgi:hypothetical protein
LLSTHTPTSRPARVSLKFSPQGQNSAEARTKPHLSPDICTYAFKRHLAARSHSPRDSLSLTPKAVFWLISLSGSIPSAGNAASPCLPMVTTAALALTHPPVRPCGGLGSGDSGPTCVSPSLLPAERGAAGGRALLPPRRFASPELRSEPSRSDSGSCCAQPHPSTRHTTSPPLPRLCHVHDPHTHDGAGAGADVT